MSELLSREDYEKLLPAETSAYPSPIPPQEISNGEFFPNPQNERQREFEARIKDMGERFGKKQGLSRRQFLKSVSGMVAAFVAMNEVYGNFFEVDRAEAAIPEMAAERAKETFAPVHFRRPHPFRARRRAGGFASQALRQSQKQHGEGGLES